MPLHNPTVHKAGEGVHIEKRPAAAVRDWQVINLGQMTGLACFCKATAKAAVRLQYVDCLAFDKFAKAPPMPLHLPCGNRYFRVRAQVSERSGIVLLQR